MLICEKYLFFIQNKGSPGKLGQKRTPVKGRACEFENFHNTLHTYGEKVGAVWD